MITVTIDGKEIRAQEGRTILEIARENDIHIPTLCYHKNLFPIGSCRLCIVEVEGYPKPMASCDTVARDGISVTTKSEKLFRMRQEYLKFLLVNHPLDCPICDAGGECQLQDLAFEHKIEKVDLTAGREERTEAPYSTALIRYASSRCVLCLRCVHACREISGRNVLSLVETGIEAKMAPVNADDCISCGECLAVCPVGALTERISPLKSRKWQTKRQATTCTHCGFGCSLTLDVYEDRFITKVLTDSDRLPNKGSLCVMGRFGYDFANHPARLAGATIKDNGTVKPVGLEESVEAVAAGLSKLIKQGKPPAFIVSPRATNEEIYMISQIAGCFPMSSVGTTGYYHTGKALEAVKRMGISPVYDYESLIGCDLVVVVGADLLANNHLLGDKVREAVKKGGARIAVIDPSPTALTRSADSWLKVTPGSDGVLFLAASKRLIDTKKYNPDAENLTGFADFAAGLAKVDETGAMALCGIDAKDFEKFVRLLSRSSQTAIVFGSGLTARAENLTALLNLGLLLGSAAKGLVMSTALQANAMGIASILPNAVSPEKVLGNPAVGGIFIYEDDPFQYLNGAAVEKSLKEKAFVAVCDALPTRVSEFADVTVPTGTFAEKEGTFIAEDGFVRTVNRARGTASPGYEFLKALTKKLCGGLSLSEAETLEGLYRGEVIVKDESGRVKMGVEAGSVPHFLVDDVESSAAPERASTLVLRNVFLNHHLADKDVYSKLTYLNNRSIAGDVLFISPDDASALDIHEGDAVSLESDAGAATEKASIKKGLRKGVVEYRMLRKRDDILKLAQGYGKHIAVTMKKG